MPQERWYHTQTGLVLCGGYHSDIRTSCLTFSSGQWIQSHTLQHWRSRHSSWASPDGPLVMGGFPNEEIEGNSTEMLTRDGQSTMYFALKYDTRWKIDV